MIDFVDLRLAPALWALADWSLRWGALIAVLAAWLRFHAPRQAAVRLLACQFILVAGLALPLVPRWWGLPTFWELKPSQANQVTSQHAPTEVVSTRLERFESSPRPSPEPVADRPSVFPTFEPTRQSIQEVNHSLGSGRWVLIGIAAAWTLGASLCFLRLLAGAIWLRQICRSAVPPGEFAQITFERCRREAAVGPAVRLGMHSSIDAPIFVGGFGCRVLVPLEWDRLPIEEQQAVLWHELAHARRRDDLAKLAEEIVRSLFFFHPLVRWLLNRIDLCREEVCDAASVRQGVAGPRFAQILLHLSQSKAVFRTRGWLRSSALQFFRRRSLKNRIDRLLDDEHVDRWLAPASRTQAARLATMVSAIMIALGSLTLNAANPPRPVPLALDDPQPRPVTPTNRLVVDDDKRKTSNGHRSQTLKRIFANWRVRQERTKSFYIKWESRKAFGREAERRGKGQFPSIRQPTQEIVEKAQAWREGEDRFRFERELVKMTVPGSSYLLNRVQDAYDGAARTLLEERQRSDHGALGSIYPRPNRIRELDHPLLLIYRTFAVLAPLRHLEQFLVVDESYFIDHRRCIQLQMVLAGGEWIENIWVDPERDDLPVVHELRLGGQNGDRLKIQYAPGKSTGWVPTHWTRLRSSDFEMATVESFKINESIPPSKFVVRFPRRTMVFNESANERYLVAKDGSKSDVIQFESAKEVRLAKWLETEIDFPITPQPLPYALEFLHARCDVAILLDELAFDASSMKPRRIEVKGGAPTMTVRELLTQILNQCPQPVGFRIENEVLRVAPGGMLEQPRREHLISTGQPANSPTAAQIKKALESPINFPITPEPFVEAIDLLRNQFKIPIVVDRPSFDREAIDLSCEVKVDADGVKLKKALAIVLNQMHGRVGYSIENDGLRMLAIETPGKPKKAASKSRRK